MGLFSKKCAMCGKGGVQLFDAVLAGGMPVKVCRPCKKATGI